jgi:CO/xanthine dehydrogenase Mo-binding subunit
VSQATSGSIGQPARRREDLRFLTGCGRYVADLTFDLAAYVAIVVPSGPSASPASAIRACELAPRS